jgi:hypothetical protein
MKSAPSVRMEGWEPCLLGMAMTTSRPAQGATAAPETLSASIFKLTTVSMRDRIQGHMPVGTQSAKKPRHFT